MCVTNATDYHYWCSKCVTQTMASFNYYLRSTKDKNKENTLYLYVTISRDQRITLNTGIKVAAKNWNPKQRVFRSSEKGSPEKNAELKKLKAKVELAFMKGRELSFDQLKLKLQGEISPVIGNKARVPLLSEAFEKFMQDMQGVYSENYLRGYQQVVNFVQGKKVLRDMPDAKKTKQRDLPITKIGSAYLADYVRWLLGAGYQNATVKKHVKFIKKVLNVNVDLYDLEGTHVKVRNIKLMDQKPFWLAHSEVRLVVDHIFSSKRMQQVVDEWLFRYYTGIRHQDSEQIERHHVRESGGKYILDFNMIKNGRDFRLPLSAAAVEMLQRYEYKLPKYSNQEKNRVIKLCFKEVGLDDLVEKVSISGSSRSVELVPKWSLVTTHCARRSFGRRWMDTVGDIEALSQYLGHSSSAVTRSYIGWEMEEFASFVEQLDFN